MRPASKKVNFRGFNLKIRYGCRPQVPSFRGPQDAHPSYRAVPYQADLKSQEPLRQCRMVTTQREHHFPHFKFWSSLSYGRVSMIQIKHNKRMGTEGLSYHHTNLLCCLDQMLAVMELSQHLVSSSKTVRPIIPRGARCMGHVKKCGLQFVH